ncbi:hypothetical protein ACXYMU_16480 [Pontibacter sp. CAU 1760]
MKDFGFDKVGEAFSMFFSISTTSAFNSVLNFAYSSFSISPKA